MDGQKNKQKFLPNIAFMNSTSTISTTVECLGNLLSKWCLMQMLRKAKGSICLDEQRSRLLDSLGDKVLASYEFAQLSSNLST